MIEVGGGGGARQATWRQPLPAFVRAEDILADALPMLDPPSRISVTDAAERYLRVQKQGMWQAFDREAAPYLVEPSDMTQSRRFRGVGFMGPSQSGKTMMLQTVALHQVTSNQRPVLVVHMSKSDRDKWVEEKLDPIIYNSPEILERLGKGRDDSTFSRKRFRGMRLTLGYPTPQMLSGGTYAMVLLTDLDHHPLVLGARDNPEGTPIRMAMQRIKSFMSQGCVLAESSPAYPVEDPDWQPRAEEPHAFAPVEGGIAKYYNEGTRGRWYWECRDCGGEYEPRIDRLHYDASLSPWEAGEAAQMACPHCGSLVAFRHRAEMNRAALKGQGGWRHEGRDGALVDIESDQLRRTDVASYALNGAAATFSRWSEIVAHLEEARREFERSDDDTDLATVHYTEIGVPYRAQRKGDGEEITVQFLRDHGHETQKGVVPDWAWFVVVSVDVQATFFPVQVTAFGPEGRWQVVDRFDLTTPPEAAPNATSDVDGNSRVLDPAKYLEDWAVLDGLAARVWPVEGAAYGLRAAAVVCDFQGRPGVSDNAERYLRGRQKAGEGSKWFFYRGHGGWRVPARVWYEAPDRKSGGGRARKIKLLNIATDRLKDTVSAALRKADGAKGALYTPKWMSTDRLEEFLAEERLSKGWEKKKGRVRNEGMDLSVVARAVAEHKGYLTINPEAPPNWARLGAQNVNAVSLDAAPIQTEHKAPPRRRVPKKLF